MTPDPEGRQPQAVYAVAAYDTHAMRFASLELFTTSEEAQAHFARMEELYGDNACMAQWAAPAPEAAAGALARELRGE